MPRAKVTLTARVPLKVLRKLKELYKRASLTNASFGSPGDRVTIRNDAREISVDDFIKERTRIHRETYVLPLIDELIGWAEGEGEET